MEKGQGPAGPLAAVTAQGRGFSAVQLRVVPAQAGIAWVETEEFGHAPVLVCGDRWCADWACSGAVDALKRSRCRDQRHCRRAFAAEAGRGLAMAGRFSPGVVGSPPP